MNLWDELGWWKLDVHAPALLVWRHRFRRAWIWSIVIVQGIYIWWRLSIWCNLHLIDAFYTNMSNFFVGMFGSTWLTDALTTEFTKVSILLRNLGLGLFESFINVCQDTGSFATSLCNRWWSLITFIVFCIYSLGLGGRLTFAQTHNFAPLPSHLT